MRVLHIDGGNLYGGVETMVMLVKVVATVGPWQLAHPSARQQEQSDDVLKLPVLGRRHRFPQPGRLLRRQEAFARVVQRLSRDAARRVLVGAWNVPTRAQLEGSAEDDPDLLDRGRR